MNDDELMGAEDGEDVEDEEMEAESEEEEGPASEEEPEDEDADEEVSDDEDLDTIGEVCGDPVLSICCRSTLSWWSDFARRWVTLLRRMTRVTQFVLKGGSYFIVQESVDSVEVTDEDMLKRDHLLAAAFRASAGKKATQNTQHEAPEFRSRLCDLLLLAASSQSTSDVVKLVRVMQTFVI